MHDDANGNLQFIVGAIGASGVTWNAPQPVRAYGTALAGAAPSVALSSDDHFTIAYETPGNVLQYFEGTLGPSAATLTPSIPGNAIETFGDLGPPRRWA